MTYPFTYVQPAARAGAAPAAEPAPPERDKTVIVTVPKDSRLEALLATYETVKARRDEAAAAYDDLTSGILAELRELDSAPDIKVYEIQATRMWPALAYGYQQTPYLPAPKVRAHIPAVWDAFKQYKESWVLRKLGKR